MSKFGMAFLSGCFETSKNATIRERISQCYFVRIGKRIRFGFAFAAACIVGY